MLLIKPLYSILFRQTLTTERLATEILNIEELTAEKLAESEAAKEKAGVCQICTKLGIAH